MEEDKNSSYTFGIKLRKTVKNSLFSYFFFNPTKKPPYFPAPDILEIIILMFNNVVFI